MIKLYEIQRGNRPQITFYDLDDSQVRSDDSVTEGFFCTLADLEAVFQAGRIYQEFTMLGGEDVPPTSAADFIRRQE